MVIECQISLTCTALFDLYSYGWHYRIAVNWLRQNEWKKTNRHPNQTSKWITCSVLSSLNSNMSVCVCVNDVKSQRTMNVALSFDWNGIESNWICEWKRSILKRFFAPCRYVYLSHMCISRRRKKNLFARKAEKQNVSVFAYIALAY